MENIVSSGDHEIERELLAPVPRRVRYTRATRIMRRVLWNVVGFFICLLYWLISRELAGSFNEDGFAVVMTVIGSAVFVGLISGLYFAIDLATQRRLLRQGIPVIGKITDSQFSLWKSQNNLRQPYFVSYCYPLPSGRTATEDIQVSKAIYEQAKTGMPVTVLHDREWPDRSRLYALLTCVEIEGAPPRKPLGGTL